MMKNKFRRIGQTLIIGCWVFGLLLAHPLGVWGQNPFGSSPVPQESTDTASDEEDESDLSEFEKLVAAETDTLVLSILEAPPTKPEQWIQDVRSLLNLNRPQFAKEDRRIAEPLEQRRGEGAS